MRSSTQRQQVLVSSRARGALPWRRRELPAPTLTDRLLGAESLPRAVREHSARLGGGAFLGVQGTRWVQAEREHAVLVLGAPRSGKTSGVVIPAILAAPGAVVSTSTKRDVIDATRHARASVGRVWVFDPSGEGRQPMSGVAVAHWSPVAAASTWDEALHTARAMTLAAGALGRGTTHENHWSERAGALLAPLLHAAYLAGEPIDKVLEWVLCQQTQDATDILEPAGEQLACHVLYGIAVSTEERERSSIFSATAGVLALYNTKAAREAARTPNFKPEQFACSTDTLYITAPAHRQALCAPLVVGLLEQIRHATYHQAQGSKDRPPVFFCLDEVANIAPIHDLPAMVSEAGGQGLHVMACLQDLSQARTRWGEQAAEGFLTLFQTKLVLAGISDPRTLEALSVVLGEIDRPMPTTTTGVSETRTFAYMAPPTTTRSHSTGYTAVRQRRVPPGEIAAIPKGEGLLVTGASRERIHLTPYHACEPWRTLTQESSAHSLLAAGRVAS